MVKWASSVNWQRKFSESLKRLKNVRIFKKNLGDEQEKNSKQIENIVKIFALRAPYKKTNKNIFTIFEFQDASGTRFYYSCLKIPYLSY